ncbi:MAG: stage II sporulation protein M [Dehalogenimonas sp.]
MNLKRWIFIAAGIFCVGLIIGLLLPDSAADSIEQTFKDIAGSAASAQGLSLFILLLLNNTLAVGASFIFSPIFLILPVVSLLMNGALITVVARLTLQDHSPPFLAAGILPHGIIEIPAYLLAQAAAICFGFNVLNAIFDPQRRSEAGPMLRKCLLWFGLAIILLIPAALVEAFITPLLLGLFN